MLLSLLFDYMFFIGSEKVGKIVYEVVVRKLILVIFEFGGKLFVIVDDIVNIKVVSECISFGKFINVG